MVAVWLLMIQVAATTELTPESVAFHPAGRWPFKAYYPDAAQRSGLAGDVQVRCKVSDASKLVDCVVLSVTPKGDGFDDSAKRLLRDVLVDPVAKDGQPSAGRTISFTIEYRSKGLSGWDRMRDSDYSVSFK